MKEIPFSTAPKEQPVGTATDKPVPVVSRESEKIPEKTSREDIALPKESKFNKGAPVDPELNKEQPTPPELTRETPTETKLNKELPEQKELAKELPLDVKKENCIDINGDLREIKPTKLKYFRNKMAAAYSVIRMIPLNEFLTYDAGVIDPDRDADQVLYDFLVAVFDDPQFIHDAYDELTADHVEQAVQIFGRLNHIDEKEEKARKNKEAQAKH